MFDDTRICSGQDLFWLLMTGGHSRIVHCKGTEIVTDSCACLQNGPQSLVIFNEWLPFGKFKCRKFEAEKIELAMKNVIVVC